MRNLLAQAVVVLAGVLLPWVIAPAARARTTAQNNAAALPFDAHDLSGVWQLAPGGGGQGPGDNFPPLTPWGQAKYDANKPGYGPKAAPGGNDPILKCDPMGFPHVFCSSDAHDRALPSRRSQHDPVQPDHR